MNHKDLLDSVVSNMASTTSEETTEVPMEEEISTDDMMKLPISTGETFLIDPESFDWNVAVTKIPEMEANNAAILKMMQFIIASDSNDDSEEHINGLHNIIKQLEEHLDGFQIKPSYDILDPDINEDRLDKLTKKATALIFDTFCVSQTMYMNTSLYSAMKLMANDKINIEKGEAISSDDIDEMLYGSDNDTETMFKVIIKDGAVFRIVEDDECAPDEVGMILPGDNDDEDIIFVNAKTIFEAHTLAEKTIKEINETGGTING